MKFCLDKNIPFVSCLGMGKKLNPQKVTITTLNKTEIDPVAKKMREFARKDGVDLKKIKVIFSSEIPLKNEIENEGDTSKERNPISSSIFVPAYAGLLCGYAFLEEVKKENDFRLVEIKSYLLDLLAQGKEFGVFTKESTVIAKKGQEGEKIATIMEDGFIETSRIVEKDDWIVILPSGEQIVVADSYFKMNYQETEKKGFYKSKKVKRNAIKVEENISFETKKGKMFLKKGGYLVYINNDDIYAVQERNFKETYKIIEQ